MSIYNIEMDKQNRFENRDKWFREIVRTSDHGSNMRST